MTQTPADPARPAKASPETLALRAAPRRIVQFKRGVIIGGAAAGALAVAAGPGWRSVPKALRLARPNEQAISDRRTPADAVANLPGDYSKLTATPGTTIPLLGAPPPMTPAQQAAQAERQRIAAQAHQAREAGVMVQSSGHASVGRAIAYDQKRLSSRTSAQREDPGPGRELSACGGPGSALGSAELVRDDSSFQSESICDSPASVGETTPAGSGVDGAALQMAAADQSASVDAGTLALDPERDQNNQQRKLDFVRATAGPGGVSNAHALQVPTSPWQVMAGSVIAASLVTRLNSDLPGMIAAQVGNARTVEGRNPGICWEILLHTF